MKISASIYSNREKNIVELVKELDLFNIDYIHIDCNDDFTVFEDIKKIKEVSNTPIDLHIISSEPQKYYPYIKDLKIELVTFQYENLKRKLELPDDLNSKIGIAVMTDTLNEVFDEYSDVASFILFMTTIPGKSGGVFNSKNFSKIKKFKKKYPSKNIHVDGGVNDEVSFILRNLGVYCSVSGSYLVKSEKIGIAILNLKSDLGNINYKIKDFMFQNNEIPILDLKAISLKSILEQISKYKLGFCIVEKENKFFGIITDGDIRRNLLLNIRDLNNINVKDIINKNAITINDDDDIQVMLKKIKTIDIPLVFIPVIGKNAEIRGAISFNSLIKGEL